MTTAIYMHEDCKAHVTPPGHPERVERLEAIEAVLSESRFKALDRRKAPLADRTELLRCHPESYIARIEATIPKQGSLALDADTHVSPGSWAAALRAVGAACAAVDAVIAGKVANAFCSTRPPGHHAETAKPMGFCLFGTAAIAAKRALDHHGLTRVAVVDFDVHHGNGTQDLLWNEARTFFVGSHQMPLWPGTGDRNETGAHGNVINLPLPPHTAGDGFRRVWEAQGCLRSTLLRRKWSSYRLDLTRTKKTLWHNSPCARLILPGLQKPCAIWRTPMRAGALFQPSKVATIWMRWRRAQQPHVEVLVRRGQ